MSALPITYDVMEKSTADNTDTISYFVDYGADVTDPKTKEQHHNADFYTAILAALYYVKTGFFPKYNDAFVLSVLQLKKCIEKAAPPGKTILRFTNLVRCCVQIWKTNDYLLTDKHEIHLDSTIDNTDNTDNNNDSIVLRLGYLQTKKSYYVALSSGAIKPLRVANVKTFTRLFGVESEHLEQDESEQDEPEQDEPEQDEPEQDELEQDEHLELEHLEPEHLEHLEQDEHDEHDEHLELEHLEPEHLEQDEPEQDEIDTFNNKISIKRGHNSSDCYQFTTKFASGGTIAGYSFSL